MIKVISKCGIRLMLVIPALSVCFFGLVAVVYAGTESENLPVLRVAVLEHRPPHFYVSQDKAVSGLAIDLLHGVAELSRFNCEYVIVSDWEEALKLVDLDMVDIIPSANINANMSGKYTFSLSTEELEIVSFIRETDRNRIKSVSEIVDSDFRVGVLNYSPACYRLRELPGRYNLMIYSRLEIAVMALLSGEVDVLLHAEPIARTVFANCDIDDKVMVVDNDFMKVPKAFLLANAALSFKDRINASIETMKQSGQVDDICKKWYSHGVFSVGHQPLYFALLMVSATSVFIAIWYGIMTQKKNREINASQNYISDILDSSDFIFIVMTPEYKIKYANAYAQTKFQYSKDELIGQNAISLLIPEVDSEGVNSREKFRNTITERVGKTFVVNENVTKHGRRFWVAWTSCWITSTKTGDRELHWFGMDITSQKEFENELRKTKMELEAILDNIGAGILFLSTDMEIISVNKEMEKVTGKSRELLIGRICNDVICLKPEISDDCPGLLSVQTASRVSKEAYVKINEHTYDVVASPLINGMGAVVGTIVILNDVTQRNTLINNLKAAHNSLEYYARILEDRVKVGEIRLEEQELNLKNATNQLIQAEKMASLGNLIAGIGHEINSPLGAIKSSGDVIQHSIMEFRELTGVLVSWLTGPYASSFFEMLEIADNYNSMEISTKEVRKKRAEIAVILNKEGVKDSELLAQRVLDIGLYDYVNNYLELLKQPQAVDMIRIVQNYSQAYHSTELIGCAVDRAYNVVFALKNFIHNSTSKKMVRTNIKENINMVLIIYCHQIKHGIEVEQDLEGLPEIMCYPDELNQVWSNLINNAIQAMDYRGKLTIAGIVDGDNIKISFTDTGCGIPEEIREMIFEPLFTTKPIGQGSGLGLDIVSKIVSKHKGSISVDSVVGSGSTFTVTLPKITEEPDQEELK